MQGMNCADTDRTSRRRASSLVWPTTQADGELVLELRATSDYSVAPRSSFLAARVNSMSWLFKRAQQDNRTKFGITQ